MAVTTTSDAPRAPRADAVRNRVKVLAATRAAFAEHGIEAQVEDIARRAGVGVGTVYRHFPTKRGLIEALVAEHFGDLIANATAALESPDPGRAFFDHLEYCFEAHSRDRMFDILGDAKEISEVKHRLVDELCVVVDELIDRARAAGAVREELCADDVGVLMCGLGAVKHAESWYRGEDPARRYFTLVLDGMRPPVERRAR
ncbi:MAG: transcriptional regulator, TetR family [Solirubrobacterales bacterium]|nr:transcriptional regulator, TetR family [Solirubrobacterales bacterium]